MSARPGSILWLKTWAQAPPSPGNMLQPQGPPGIASGKQSLWTSEANSRPQAKLPWLWHFICRKRLDATPSLPRCSEGVTGPFPFSTVGTPLPGALCPFHTQTAQLWPEPLGSSLGICWGSGVGRGEVNRTRVSWLNE